MYSTGIFAVGVAICVVIALQGCCAVDMVSVEPSSLSAEEGSTVTFVCRGPNGIKWYRSGSDQPLVSAGKFHVFFTLFNGSSNGTLEINNVSINESGSYSCREENNEFEVSLAVFPVKDVVVSPDMPLFVEGETLLLNCTVNGATDQTVEWTVNKGSSEEELSGGDDASHVQVYNNGSLIIRDLLPEDAGIYTCTHIFPEGTKAMSVNVGGEITLAAENSVKFTEGDRALIECKATVITSALLPNITWMINGEDYALACPDRCTVMEEATEHSVTSKLEIIKITMDDRKNYTCTAVNGASDMEKVILLRVRDRLAALWPFLGIVTEVVILIIIIFIHEKCSKGEDYGEDDEDDEDTLKKEKQQIQSGDSDMRMRSTKE